MIIYIIGVIIALVTGKFITDKISKHFNTIKDWEGILIYIVASFLSWIALLMYLVIFILILLEKIKDIAPKPPKWL